MPTDHPNVTLTIQNIVSSVDLHTSINLEQAAVELPSTVQVSYIPDQFPGLILKLRKPKVSLLLFSSGKCVVTGAKTLQQTYQALEILIDLLNSMGMLIADDPTVTVQNVVASGNFYDTINLELAALIMDTSMYEPEVFPGLIYRMQNPKAVLLLFQSGKFVCTGCKTEEVAYEAAMKTRILLEDADAFGWALDL